MLQEKIEFLLKNTTGKKYQIFVSQGAASTFHNMFPDHEGYISRFSSLGTPKDKTSVHSSV